MLARIRQVAAELASHRGEANARIAALEKRVSDLEAAALAKTVANLAPPATKSPAKSGE